MIPPDVKTTEDHGQQHAARQEMQTKGFESQWHRRVRVAVEVANINIFAWARRWLDGWRPARSAFGYAAGVAPVNAAPGGVLKRVLGLGFGLAVVFGGTVGVGILRLPGDLAAQLGNAHWVLGFWILGGFYALLGAVSVAELASMMPRAGGFYVYAARAFGKGVGFAVGWSDWLNNAAALAYASITAITFLGALWPPVMAFQRSATLLLLAFFVMLHWTGLRIGSSLTRVISVAIGTLLLVLVAACFIAAPAVQVVPSAHETVTLASRAAIFGTLSSGIMAMRAVLLTYDGWYSSIYLAEESMHPERTLPRSLIGGTLIVAALYVLINAGLLRALPLTVLAGSTLPAADAAARVLPHGGATVITVVSLLTVLSLVNVMMLSAPRILLAIGRDGSFTRRAARVSPGGTPRVALVVSVLAAAGLILSGTFEQIQALAAVLFLLVYLSAYVAVFVLRQRNPLDKRPYRTWGYPVSTAVVGVGSILALIAMVYDDPRSGRWAAYLLAACVPVYWAIRYRTALPAATT